MAFEAFPCLPSPALTEPSPQHFVGPLRAALAWEVVLAWGALPCSSVVRFFSSEFYSGVRGLSGACLISTVLFYALHFITWLSALRPGWGQISLWSPLGLAHSRQLIQLSRWIFALWSTKGVLSSQKGLFSRLWFRFWKLQTQKNQGGGCWALL